MAASVRLQGGVCRWPGCDCRRRGIKVDPAHWKVVGHRGIGGNPSGDRTRLDGIMALCRNRHEDYDHSRIDFEPLSDKGTLGPCEFFRIVKGERISVGRERLVGILENQR